VVLQPKLAAFIRANAQRCAIVTGNLDCWIGPYVKERLGCHLFSSVAKVDGDQLLGIDSILDKGTAVAALRAHYGWDRVVCVGDGMNDVPMLEQADVAVAYGAIHEPSKNAVEAAHYVTYNASALCHLISRF
jgi:phosphoserine phosphatase